MSSIIDAFSAPGPDGPQHSPRKKKYADGWEPRLELDETDGGFLVSKPSEENKSHAEIFEEYNLKVEDWVVDKVRKNRRQLASGQWVESHFISFLPRNGRFSVNMPDLEKTISNWRPKGKYSKNPERASFFAPTGDTQIGKACEKGGGSPETVDRVLSEHGKGLARFNYLNTMHDFEQVVLPQLGDCIEGRTSQGGKNVWRTDLGMTEMVRVYRRLLWTQIKSYANVAPKVLIPVIGGNHDEAARDGHGTTATDSWAIDAASALWENVQENDDLRDRVKFIFPEFDELSVVFDASGTIVGINHGHKFGADVFKWWNGQSGMRSPIGDADVLLAGHLHHLRVQDHSGGRLFIQVPALDGGSRWFEQSKGVSSPPRAITFWTADGRVHDLDPVGRSR